MATTQTEIPLRNRDLYGAQIGLAILSGARRGKVDLFGTFKHHLSVHRAAVDKEIERLSNARRDLRDSHAKLDGKNQPMVAQMNEKDPNATQVILADPVAFERDERQLLDEAVVITVRVPKLKLADVLALDFGEQQGDYAGALMFVEEPAEPDAPRAEA